MGFKVKKYTIHSDETIFLYFDIEKSLKESEFLSLIDILQEYIDDGTPFLFLIDCSICTDVPLLTASTIIINWMKKNKKKIPNTLIASSIVIKNSIINNILKFSFSIRKPVSPNKITKDINKSINFLSEYSPGVININIKK